jgi:3-methyladenine DNA glycosylase AlkC
MIDKELELYYRNIRDMFGSPGWKQLMEDLNSNAMVINSVEAAKDNEDLYLRKGQLAVIANLLNLEAQIDASEAEALKEEEEDSEEAA